MFNEARFLREIAELRERREARERLQVREKGAWQEGAVAKSEASQTAQEASGRPESQMQSSEAAMGATAFTVGDRHPMADYFRPLSKERYRGTAGADACRDRSYLLRTFRC